MVSARSNSTGRFLILGAEPGRCELEMDGTTARDPGKSYGRFYPGVYLATGGANVLPYTIWMTTSTIAGSVELRTTDVPPGG